MFRADMSSSILVRTDLSGARLLRANVNDVQMVDSVWVDTILPDGTVFNPAQP
jgi:hypothetical protein